MNEEDRMAIEVNIMLALFHATVEQQEHLNEEYKHKAKAIFKDWKAKGYQMQKQISKHGQADEYYEHITQVIEDVVHEVRKLLTNKQ